MTALSSALKRLIWVCIGVLYIATWMIIEPIYFILTGRDWINILPVIVEKLDDKVSES